MTLMGQQPALEMLKSCHGCTLRRGWVVQDRAGLCPVGAPSMSRDGEAGDHQQNNERSAKRLAQGGERAYVVSKKSFMERKMGSVAFDTLKAAKQLGEAGFEPEQAEALVTTFAGELNDNLVTKEDLEQVEKRLIAEHRDVRKDMKALDTKIDTVEERLTGEIKTLDAKIDTVEERLNTKIDTVEERLAGEIKAVEERLTGAMKTQGAELRQEIAEQGKTLGNQIGEVKTEVEQIRTQIATAHLVQLRWMIGMIVGLAAVLVAALAAFQ